MLINTYGRYRTGARYCTRYVPGTADDMIDDGSFALAARPPPAWPRTVLAPGHSKQTLLEQLDLKPPLAKICTGRSDYPSL